MIVTMIVVITMVAMVVIRVLVMTRFSYGGISSRLRYFYSNSYIVVTVLAIISTVTSDIGSSIDCSFYVSKH